MSNTNTLPSQFKRVGIITPVPFPAREGAISAICVLRFSIIYLTFPNNLFLTIPKITPSVNLPGGEINPASSHSEIVAHLALP